MEPHVRDLYGPSAPNRPFQVVEMQPRLALSRALIGSALSISALLPVRRPDAACGPVAVLDGPPDITRPTQRILRVHGVGSGAGHCTGHVVHAGFTRMVGSPGYTLQIHDQFGRSSQRCVDDAETAAALIETWATNEDAELLSPSTKAGAAQPVVAVELLVAEPETVWHAAASIELSAGTDGSRWRGARVMACRTLGALCAGGTIAIARDDGSSGPAATLEQIQTTAEALVSITWFRSRGRFHFAPSLALGAAWTSVSPQAGTDTAPASRVALRTDVAIVGAVAISRRWSITGELGAGLNVPSTSADSGSDFSLAGPAALFRGGVGVGYAR